MHTQGSSSTTVLSQILEGRGCLELVWGKVFWNPSRIPGWWDASPARISAPLLGRKRLWELALQWRALLDFLLGDCHDFLELFWFLEGLLRLYEERPGRFLCRSVLGRSLLTWDKPLRKKVPTRHFREKDSWSFAHFQKRSSILKIGTSLL